MYSIAKKTELISKVDDERILLKAFNQEEDIEFRKIILDKTKNADLIDSVAQEKYIDTSLRCSALARCSKNVLKKIMEDSSEEVYARRLAILRFEDKDYDWYKLFKQEKSNAMGREIIKKINNQSQLVQIAMYESDNLIIKRAIESVTDEKNLLEVFRYEGFYELKAMVLKKLHNEENIISAINRIDVSEANDSLLNIVLNKLVFLKREDIIYKIVIKLRNEIIIGSYMVYINNEDFLDEIFRNSYHWYACVLAKEKLDKINP